MTTMGTMYKNRIGKRWVVQQHGWMTKRGANEEAQYFREHGLEAIVLPIKEIPRLRKKHGSKGHVVLTRRPTAKKRKKLAKRRRKK